MEGTFIVFDGCEGCGKSTVARFVKDHLDKREIKAVLTREPGGSPYAEKIRETILCDGAKEADAQTMFCLFWAARRDHVVNVIRPALKAGSIVICDRFDSTTYAYQIIASQGIHSKDFFSDFFWQMRRMLVAEVVPDSYLFFDADPSITVPRARRRRAEDVNHFDERDAGFHERARHGFLEFGNYVPHEIVDVNRPLEQVQADVLQRVLRIAGQATPE